MKTFASAAGAILAFLATLSIAVGQDDSASTGGAASANPSGNTLALNEAQIRELMTNVFGKLGGLAINIHVESVTLNLNGFAMVGLNNTLTQPSAEQFITWQQGDVNQVGTNGLRGVVSPIEKREGRLKLESGNLTGLLSNNTNLLTLASNLLGAAEKGGLTFGVGKVTLNLNGYALVGATNSFDGLTTKQWITNAPSASGKHSLSTTSAQQLNELQAGTRDDSAMPSYLVGDVTVDLNGTISLGLPVEPGRVEPTSAPPPPR